MKRESVVYISVSPSNPLMASLLGSRRATTAEDCFSALLCCHRAEYTVPRPSIMLCRVQKPTKAETNKETTEVDHLNRLPPTFVAKG